jgi:hypothetical protein
MKLSIVSRQVEVNPSCFGVVFFEEKKKEKEEE